MYITSDVFIEKFPVFVEESETTINNRIAEAESLIDSYLNGNVVIDPDNIPPILERIAADLACYYFQQSNLQAIGEDSHNAMYNNAVRLLEKIASGTIKITTPTPTATAEDTGSVAIISTAGAYEYRS